MRRSIWVDRLGRLAMWASILAALAAVIGATLARYDAISKLAGFSALFVGLPVAVLAGLLALIVLLVALVRRLIPKRPALIALIVSAAFTGGVLAVAGPGLSAPAIHDVSTDLDDPPAFAKLALREDNLAGVETEENWRRIHREAYGDIVAIELDKPVAEVVADAERLARARGWRVALSDPQAGRLEATAFSSYFRFNDDLVLRVVPAGTGGSRVDMRSVSRVGVGDLGVNAERVRSFLADLKAA